MIGNDAHWAFYADNGIAMISMIVRTIEGSFFVWRSFLLVSHEEHEEQEEPKEGELAFIENWRF